jgi:hypothetical protein
MQSRAHKENHCCQEKYKSKNHVNFKSDKGIVVAEDGEQQRTTSHMDNNRLSHRGTTFFVCHISWRSIHLLKELLRSCLPPDPMRLETTVVVGHGDPVRTHESAHRAALHPLQSTVVEDEASRKVWQTVSNSAATLGPPPMLQTHHQHDPVSLPIEARLDSWSSTQWRGDRRKRRCRVTGDNCAGGGDGRDALATVEDEPHRTTVEIEL